MSKFMENKKYKSSDEIEKTSIQLNANEMYDGIFLSAEFHNNKDFINTLKLLLSFKHELQKYLKSKNPTSWEQWKGNCCRQVALFNTVILKEIFKNKLKVKMMDCQFERMYKSKVISYNHAFTVMYPCKVDFDYIYLIDLERVPLNYNIASKIKTTDLKFPHKDVLSYENDKFVKELSNIDNKFIDNAMMYLDEFYSGERSIDLLNKILLSIPLEKESSDYNTFVSKVISQVKSKYKN